MAAAILFLLHESSIVKEKVVLYELWISPNKDKVELVIDAESKYSQVIRQVSAVFRNFNWRKVSDRFGKFPYQATVDADCRVIEAVKKVADACELPRYTNAVFHPNSGSICQYKVGIH
jgi:hypothetical protein